MFAHGFGCDQNMWRFVVPAFARSSAMAPVIIGNPEHPELGQELTNSFCRADPQIARQFAEVTPAETVAAIQGFLFAPAPR